MLKQDVETFDTSNYELERPLPKGKYIKVIGLMRDELGGKIMTKFVGLRAKTYVVVKIKKQKHRKGYHKKKA